MVIQKCDIKFTIIGENEEHLVETYTGEYRNLMALITDKIYVEDFGDCHGMGRCGTCVVEIMNTENKINCLNIAYIFKTSLGSVNGSWTEGNVNTVKKITLPNGSQLPYVSGQSTKYQIRKAGKEMGLRPHAVRSHEVRC